jgi:hypothetical protein
MVRSPWSFQQRCENGDDWTDGHSCPRLTSKVAEEGKLMTSNRLVSTSARIGIHSTVFISLFFGEAIPRSVPAEWKAPKRFVGIGGRIGSYEEAQAALDQLEWQQVHQTAERASLSLEQLRSGQLAWRNAFTSIEVEFSYALERKMETARMIEEKKANRAVPADFKFDAHIAIKGEKRFTYFRDTSASAVPKATANAVPRRKRAQPPEFKYAFDGSQMRTFEPSRSVGQLHPAKLDGVDSQHMWYCDAISVPTGSRAQTQIDSVWYVPTALKSAPIYTVLPTLQEVDGEKCHVVSSGFDSLWIDPAHGFSVRRRVWFQLRNLTDPPVLAFVYVNKDFREADHDIWLPRTCYRIDFAGPQEPKPSHGMLTEVHSVLAKNIAVNSVSDDLFKLTFPPGTEVQDLVLNKSFVVPHGEHLLDEAIAKANPIINGEVIPAGFPVRPPVASSLRWLVIANAIALAFILAWIYLRRRRRPK